MKSQFIIAAPHSGAGKTTVTLGLLRALRRKGLRVQPFKCGPDFIDPIHHRTAAGRDSINLDRYMMSDDHIRFLYDLYSTNADSSITEGVMGLFDGSVKSEGSTADLAKLLALPIVLVLNAKAMAYSAAAILFGLKNFDPSVRIAGVVFNFVETESHYRFLREACADAGVNPLGYLPVNPALRIQSRYLGLDTSEAETAIEAAADHIEKHIRLEELLALTSMNRQPDRRSGNSLTRTPGYRTVLIAKDAAFQFLYRENIRRLEQWGSVKYFSPLQATQLPGTPDLLYFPGGYPELFLKELAGNTSLMEQLRAYATAGGRIIAECGGMMYLGHSITDEDGQSHLMTGILDISTGIEQKKLSLGYRTIRLPGGMAKGHEFHYSHFLPRQGHPAPEITGGYNARGERIDIPFFYTPGVLASYLHLYWGEETGFLESWLSGEHKPAVATKSQK